MGIPISNGRQHLNKWQRGGKKEAGKRHADASGLHMWNVVGRWTHGEREPRREVE